jgi:hypothetical protein
LLENRFSFGGLQLLELLLVDCVTIVVLLGVVVECCLVGSCWPVDLEISDVVCPALSFKELRYFI